jgi:RNA polymerase sigma-70 factor (ECF subfamily)
VAEVTTAAFLIKTLEQALALRLDDVDLVRDRALVERFQEGDPAAFATLYTRYFGRLVRFCQKRVGDPHEAEEIAQEAFTKALRALPAFEGERRFYPWMTVIAGRLCVDAHRRRGRTEPSPTVDLGVIEGGQEKIVDLVDIEILRSAMVQLAPRHREVLDLRELQGWSYQQIADHYGVTLGTVEALLFRARKALKREFMAVVGGDRNWAAVPVLGGVLRRAASWKARAEAWSAAVLPTLSGPAMAAALAVTAVTGAVGAGVIHDHVGSGPAATTTVVSIANHGAAASPLGELLDDPTTTIAGAAADHARVTDAAGPRDDAVTRPAIVPLAPRADTDGVDLVGSETAAEKSREQPVGDDVEGVFFGIDPAAAASEITSTITTYRNELEVLP